MRGLIVSVVLSVTLLSGTSLGQSAPCAEMASISQAARELMTRTLDVLPVDAAHYVSEVGVSNLTYPDVRAGLLDMLGETSDPQRAPVREHFAATINALPALDALSRSSALLAANCPTN